MALLDADRLVQADAIVLLEGDGTWRVSEAVRLFESNWAPVILFSGGVVKPEYGSLPYEVVLPCLLEQGIPREAIHLEGESRNTYEQAVNVLGIAAKEMWTRLIIVASHYHHYRAFLTFLKVMDDLHMEVVFSSAPARLVPWFVDHGWKTRFDLLHEEFEKIQHYQALKHLATFEEAIAYFRWKEGKILSMRKV